ncbi:hypothetical protein Ea357_057 [Erwinia phage Ea35-70]|uniref:Uncharacterized protein n=4 Tax=Agricanvirus TaxID=1984776 RepID=W6ARH9_9CAUD|nr:hypothetical protein Ea357_057 [Erwinia phage Ea35-70]YP_009605203.1 hypothetical protein FDH97_gp060 [Erwinia phage vB_EamM_Deimos-Minion]AUG86807.1 hypothetical protein MORTIMER_58 [Erwinia phage vB_EamM_Mortimer]QBP07166.1 hypothetical protein REBECCA_58 [Erwinia phage Rebecca]AHI60207.1 hypothetical protein Ea357_057 [Erwinia phage Ea35-70]ANH52158.1 hypothetical protein DM_60 [Erwinia phage vB_EamM_Deimos-Minion]
MSGIFAAQGRNLVFPTQLEKRSGLYYTPPPEACWMPWGRYFPLSATSFNILEHFMTGEDLPRESSYSTHVLGILVTPNGLIYEYINTVEGIRRRVVPLGKGAVYCRSDDPLLEEAMTAAMVVHDQLVDAITLVGKSRKLMTHQYKYTTLDKVYAEIKERKIVLQPPTRNNLI